MNMANNAIDKIKKLHSAMSIERKDVSLKDLLAQEADKKTNVLTIEVTGFASKYVSKYHNENNSGMHTMVYLKDGRKTGAFSNALFELARFFYKGAGLDEFAQFNKIELKDGGFIKLNVALVKLDGGRTTYNFEIVDGNIDAGVEKLGQITNAPLLIEG
jgi:hypothetical protein